jgi:hypothetical protein
MKRRVLSYGTSGTHSSISPLSDFGLALSISDYDAFILDPVALANHAFMPDILYRRRKELRDLVQVKGGIVICILRAEPLVNFGQAGVTPAYTLFDPAGHPQVTFLRAKLQLGLGSQIRLVQTAKGAVSGYLRVLQQHLHFEAYLETDDASVVQSGGTVFAVNSLGSPVALEFSVGGGRLCFVPVAEGITGERLGAAFAQVVDAHFGGKINLGAGG